VASQSSFDISTGADLQEVDNAVNQARKELAQRYDFKGSKASIEFAKAKAQLVLVADDDFRMRALFDLLQGRLIKRGVPVKNLVVGDVTPAANSTVRREIGLTQGIAGDKAKEITAHLKKSGVKVQASIQGPQLRVTSKSKDALQEAMGVIRAGDFKLDLQFENFR